MALGMGDMAGGLGAAPMGVPGAAAAGGAAPAIKPLAGVAQGSVAPAGPAGPAAPTLAGAAAPAQKKGGFLGKLAGLLPGKLPGMPGGVNNALSAAKTQLQTRGLGGVGAAAKGLAGAPMGVVKQEFKSPGKSLKKGSALRGGKR